MARASALGLSGRDVRAWGLVAAFVGCHTLWTRSLGAPPTWSHARVTIPAPAMGRPPPLLLVGGWALFLSISLTLLVELGTSLYHAAQRSMEEPLAAASRGREAAIEQLASRSPPRGAAAASPTPAAAAAAGGSSSSSEASPGPAAAAVVAAWLSPREAARAAAAARLAAAGAAGPSSVPGPLAGAGTAAAAAAVEIEEAAAAGGGSPEAAADGGGLRRRRALPPGARDPASGRDWAAEEQRQRDAGEKERQAAAEDARQRLERHRALADAARDAEERQRVWLSQMGGGAGGVAGREATEQLWRDREIRAATDREYEESLRADQERSAARAAEAAREAAAAEREAAARASRAQLRSALPPEPSIFAPGAVRVRVRLPSGASVERLWAPEATVGNATDWVQSLEEAQFSLSWTPGSWALATSYPHALLRDRERALADVAGGAATLALFVSPA